MTFNEIADALKSSKSTVFDRHRRARRKLEASPLNNLSRIIEKHPLDSRHPAISDREAIVCLETVVSKDFNSRYALRLADLYVKVHRFQDAEPIYRTHLEQIEKQHGPDNLEASSTMDKLARLYHQWGKYPDAEQLCLALVTLWEQGPDKWRVASALRNLGKLYIDWADHQEGKAEVLYRKAADSLLRVLPLVKGGVGDDDFCDGVKDLLVKCRSRLKTQARRTSRKKAGTH
jgi:tetratricopeptide (TPR) repeat protein